MPTRDRRALRATLLAFVAVAALALATFVVAVATARDTDSGSPENTVKDFLVSAVVDHDGPTSCRYLTPRAQAQISAVTAPHTSCEDAIWSARLVLGGREVASEAAVKDLSARVEQHGATARVSVGGRTFELRRATGEEQRGFSPPPTPWRIDGGVAALIAR